MVQLTLKSVWVYVCVFPAGSMLFFFVLMMSLKETFCFKGAAPVEFFFVFMTL